MADGETTLDPASVADSDAIRELLQRRRHAFERPLLDLARRVQAESPDPLVRIDAVNVLASAAVVSGDDAEGSRLFRQALHSAWGTGTHAERVACVNLAMILTRQRRLLEAFALSRRACRVALDSGDPLATCLAHVQLGKTLLELGDLPGFQSAIAVADSQRPEYDEMLSRWVPHLLAGMRAEVALQRGEIEQAERHIDEALAGGDIQPEVRAMGRAVHLRRIGRPREALAIIQAALAAGAGDSSNRLRFQGEELLCLVDVGDHAAARERAAGCLAEMRRGGRYCGTPTWRMRVGETVSTALAQQAGAMAEARQALEIAAVAALERTWESRTFFQGFPQLGRMQEEDLVVLEAHAERFRAKHLDLMAMMRALLHEGARLEGALAESGVDEFLLSVCAWCKRVRGPDHVWIPLDDFVPSTDLHVTHGICQACTASLRATGRSAEPGG